MARKNKKTNHSQKSRRNRPIMRLSPARRELAIDDIHELTDSDLAAVSGGALNAAMAGALAGAAKGAGPRDDGVLPTLPCDSVDILCRIFF